MKKFLIFFCCLLVTQNAWCGVCERQTVNKTFEKLNNDKYLYFNVDKYQPKAFICGDGCADGAKIFMDSMQAYVAGSWLVESGFMANSQGFWNGVECSDKRLDSKWVQKNDSLKSWLTKCTSEQFENWSRIGVKNTDKDGLFVVCKDVYYEHGGQYCVSSDPNNETICWISQEDFNNYFEEKARQEQKEEREAAKKAEESEKKKEIQKKDCGNVGQRECDGRYWVCNTNTDCGTGHLPVNATVGHCVSAGRNGYKVCTATACVDGYELARDKNGNYQGWCQKKSENSENVSKENTEIKETSVKTQDVTGGQDKNSESGNGEIAKTSETQVPTKIFDDMDNFISKHFVGSSVWKNDDGDFNTARLVSDSVAGVVLGTVGGVITSKIVKKNQIKSGFENLKCTIGGQDVAAYGDEFTVGVN